MNRPTTSRVNANKDPVSNPLHDLPRADTDINDDFNPIDIDDDYEELLETAYAEAQERKVSPQNGSINGSQASASSSKDSYVQTLNDEAKNAWTAEEVRVLKHELREKGMIWWMKEYVVTRHIPVPRLLYAFGVGLSQDWYKEKQTPEQLNEACVPLLKVTLVRFLRKRKRNHKYNTVDDAVNLIRSSRRIMILTGAGISVSCGIPDFRSRNGLYAMLREQGQYDLDDPQQMFDINYFRENPTVFYSFARQIYPSNFQPSSTHRFIKQVEDKGKLLRNYTQNIDTLENAAGITSVLQCHGSFSTASCIQCRRKVDGREIEEDIMAQRIPVCSICNPPKEKGANKKRRKGKKEWEDDSEDEEPLFPAGIMKPDITFFHEKLTDNFDRLLFEDRDKVDLLIVIGTSLKVTPVSEILTHIPHSVPQILINKTAISHANPDIVLLGNSDKIIQYLADKLAWALHGQVEMSRRDSKAKPFDIPPEDEPHRVGDSHVWLFEGQEGGDYVNAVLYERARRKDKVDQKEKRPSQDREDNRVLKKARPSI